MHLSRMPENSPPPAHLPDRGRSGADSGKNNRRGSCHPVRAGDDGVLACGVMVPPVSSGTFQYLAKDYGFKVYAIEGVSTGTEPSNRHVADLIDETKKQHVKAIFLESMLNPKVTMEITKEHHDLRTAFLFSAFLKRAGGEGRSTPLLHSWFVQRGDGLILRTLSPNFALTPKLQHYHLSRTPEPRELISNIKRLSMLQDAVAAYRSTLEILPRPICLRLCDRGAS
jgi:substrate-binding protein of zinc uptake complex component A